MLERKPTEGFGFSVRGDSPVVVADIEEESVASVRNLFTLNVLLIL